LVASGALEGPCLIAVRHRVRLDRGRLLAVRLPGVVVLPRLGLPLRLRGAALAGQDLPQVVGDHRGGGPVLLAGVVGRRGRPGDDGAAVTRRIRPRTGPPGRGRGDARARTAPPCGASRPALPLSPPDQAADHGPDHGDQDDEGVEVVHYLPSVIRSPSSPAPPAIACRISVSAWRLRYRM